MLELHTSRQPSSHNPENRRTEPHPPLDGEACPSVAGTGTGSAVGAWIAERKADAQTLRRYGDERGANIIDRLLESLEGVLREADAELVNLTQAAARCGYSTDQLRRLIRAGKLTDYGRPGAPRVRPADLPRKARGLPSDPPSLHLGGAARQQTARSIVNSIQ